MTETPTGWDRWSPFTDSRQEDTARPMTGGPDETDRTPSLEAVLTTIEDADCRTLLASLDRPKSAAELRQECGLPRSTVYRKLDRLADAALVSEYTEIRRDGPNATLYERDVTAISIEIDDEDEFDLQIECPPADPTDRMAAFWAGMKGSSDGGEVDGDATGVAAGDATGDAAGEAPIDDGSGAGEP
ncbi:winged helix-turn-helix domain-containing protein [Halovivax cerinus]|uniref:Helix-turn-helix domain-containing protein n=1 Tax=Halovivax cerinus TaxID=1487865 RepID=A0ABD5NPR5_9EURY|nr:helix-turn-helix domain-containing protein [Halovivax cerinus]